jgi:hypothetical protein
VSVLPVSEGGAVALGARGVLVPGAVSVSSPVALTREEWESAEEEEVDGEESALRVKEGEGDGVEEALGQGVLWSEGLDVLEPTAERVAATPRDGVPLPVAPRSSERVGAAEPLGKAALPEALPDMERVGSAESEGSGPVGVDEGVPGTPVPVGSRGVGVVVALAREVGDGKLGVSETKGESDEVGEAVLSREGEERAEKVGRVGVAVPAPAGEALAGAGEGEVLAVAARGEGDTEGEGVKDALPVAVPPRGDGVPAAEEEEEGLEDGVPIVAVARAVPVPRGAVAVGARGEADVLGLPPSALLPEGMGVREWDCVLGVEGVGKGGEGEEDKVD